VMESGRIRQIGTPREVFQRPASTFVANFIGATPMNLIDAQVVNGQLDLGGFALPVPDGFTVAEGDKIVYGLRPEYLRCTANAPDSKDVVQGTVAAVENLGVNVLVAVDVGEHSLRAVVPEADEPELGSTVWLMPAPRRALLYRGDDGELIGS
ncbi:MAG: TOBE domain-containing protein, partial [Pseudonocardiales bacterium]